MKDILCINIDAESKVGAPIAKRFGVNGYPALLLLTPEGTPDEKIGGYLPPDNFKKEIQRVRSGKGTVSDLRKQVGADKKNLDKRFQLANKLKELGDTTGHDALLAEIKKLDPDGKSLPMRRLAYDAVVEKINAGFQESQELDTASMVAFLQKETYPEILFDGYSSLGRMHLFLGEKAGQDDRDDEVKKHSGEARGALKTAWKYVPKDQVAQFGNTLAWSYYEARDELAPADKAFALEVAEKASAAGKDDVNVIDTYACCLFMNDKKDQALLQIARCIELEPKKQAWKDRLSEFQK